MQLQALLFFALVAFTSALPTDSPTLAPRACQVAWPPGNRIWVQRNATVNIITAVNFAIPANAGGPCSLIYTFPAGYPVSSSGQASVNVVAVDGPVPGSIVGTTTFSSDPGQPKTATINSFACRPSMRYSLELAGAVGSVSFAQGNGAGVALTYSC